MTPSECFGLYKRGRNFMTPGVIKYGQKGKYFYELSKGRFMGIELYGVTLLEVLHPHRTEQASDASKSFNSEAEALQYINSL